MATRQVIRTANQILRGFRAGSLTTATVQRIHEYITATYGEVPPDRVPQIMKALVLNGTVTRKATKPTTFTWNGRDWNVDNPLAPATGNAPSPAVDSKVAELERRLQEARNELATAREALAAQPATVQPTSHKDGVLKVQLIDANGVVVKVTEGMFHEKFERIVSLAKARRNIFIYGPTGCGKSHVCAQVAAALNLPFHFVSCTVGMSESHLTGRLLPVGEGGNFEYVISEFIRCYEEGGVFLLDEMDAADPNVLLVINAALANGKMSVPSRIGNPYANKHPDFICIAAANTVGTGSDRTFTGRNKLDGATLDRFAIGKLRMDYDTRIEECLCPDPILRNRLWYFRKKINDARLERYVSTRFMADAYVMMSQEGWTLAMVEEAFFEGWRSDEVAKVA